MALNDESRALLQLLLVRGKSYDEIATLLGIGTAEVADRSAAAISTLTGGSPALDPTEVDYLLGQADPIRRSEAVRALASDGAMAETYGDVRDQLLLLFPESDIPVPPVPGSSGTTARPKSTSMTSGRSESKEPSAPGLAPAPAGASEAGAPARSGLRGSIEGPNRTVLAALVAAVGLAAIVAVVILLSSGGAEQEVAEEPPGPTVAVLRPPEGREGRGKVEFGFAGDRFAANIALSELAPNGEGDGYALWLRGPAGSFPFDSAKVGQEGTITGRSEISQAIICFIAADLFTEVTVSRVGDDELTRTLRRAVNRNVRQADFPDYVGQTALSGPISMPLESREQIIEACGGREAAAAGGNQGS